MEKVLHRKTGQLSVVGRSYVVALVPASIDRPERLEILKPGDSAQLHHLRYPSIPIAQALNPDIFGP